MITLNCFLTYVMINWSISLKNLQVVLFFFGFSLETLWSSKFCGFELNLDLIHCFSTCIMSFNLFMHHIVFFFFLFYIFLFVLTCSLPLVLFLFLLSFYCVLLVLILAPCLGRLELIGFPLPLLCLPLGFSCLRTTVVMRFLRN